MRAMVIFCGPGPIPAPVGELPPGSIGPAASAAAIARDSAEPGTRRPMQAPGREASAAPARSLAWAAWAPAHAAIRAACAAASLAFWGYIGRDCSRPTARCLHGHGRYAFSVSALCLHTGAVRLP